MSSISIHKVQLIKESSVEFDNATVKSPDDAADIARNFYTHTYGGMLPDREVSIVLSLSTKNQVSGIEIISIGSLNAAIVHPREVFKGAILHNAASIIFSHNHPSGDPSPSPEDIHITNRLKDAGEVLGIEVLDHIVIGDSRHVSFKERGLI